MTTKTIKVVTEKTISIPNGWAELKLTDGVKYGDKYYSLVKSGLVKSEWQEIIGHNGAIYSDFLKNNVNYVGCAIRQEVKSSKVKLNDEYTATISPDGVEVGGYIFSFEKINELVAAVKSFKSQ
jgi:hypothetical protein